MSYTAAQQSAIDNAPAELKAGFNASLHVHLFDVINDLVVYRGYQAQAPVTTKPQINLTNALVVSASAQKVGDIWWLPESEQFTLTANVALPDSKLMVMIERVIDGSNVVDDMRVIADIKNGVVTIAAKFKTSGNYQITAERLNRGLARIGQDIELVFDRIEFDVYV